MSDGMYVDAVMVDDLEKAKKQASVAASLASPASSLKTVFMGLEMKARKMSSRVNIEYRKDSSSNNSDKDMMKFSTVKTTGDRMMFTPLYNNGPAYSYYNDNELSPPSFDSDSFFTHPQFDSLMQLHSSESLVQDRSKELKEHSEERYIKTGTKKTSPQSSSPPSSSSLSSFIQTKAQQGHKGKNQLHAHSTLSSTSTASAASTSKATSTANLYPPPYPGAYDFISSLQTPMSTPNLLNLGNPSTPGFQIQAPPPPPMPVYLPRVPYIQPVPPKVE